MSDHKKAASDRNADIAKEVILAFLRAALRDEFVIIHEDNFDDAAECTNLDDCAAIIARHGIDAEKRIEVLLNFAQDVVREYAFCDDVDGGSIQDRAERIGLIELRKINPNDPDGVALGEEWGEDEMYFFTGTSCPVDERAEAFVVELRDARIAELEAEVGRLREKLACFHSDSIYVDTPDPEEKNEDAV